MCEFCLKHGDGQRWYLNAKNYAEDLLSDVRRHGYVEEFFTDPKKLGAGVRSLRLLERLPAPIRTTVRNLVTRKMKKIHFGQVVPLEEIKKIFAFVSSVVRVPCICRHVLHKGERGCCYGLSISPDGGKLKELLAGLDKSFINGPDSAGLEVLSPDEALAAIASHEQEGLCHTIWTFQTPFICGICNCKRTDCLAMRSLLDHSVATMFPGEYTASLNTDLCTGCGACTDSCQFGALSLPPASLHPLLNDEKCYGCGLCRAACPHGALSLIERR